MLKWLRDVKSSITLFKEKWLKNHTINNVLSHVAFVRNYNFRSYTIHCDVERVPGFLFDDRTLWSKKVYLNIFFFPCRLKTIEDNEATLQWAILKDVSIIKLVSQVPSYNLTLRLGNCEIQRGLHCVRGKKTNIGQAIMVVFCCREAMWTLTSTGSFSFLSPGMAIQDSGCERNSRM